MHSTLCSEKNTHSHFLLYLCGKCLDLHKIFQECLVGNKYSTGGKIRYSFLLVTSCFRVCKLRVLPLKTGIWWNVKTHQLVIVLTEPKNMLICRAVFHCELFLWFIFLAECEILNFPDVGILTCTASLRGWPLACYQSNGLILPVMSIF